MTTATAVATPRPHLGQIALSTIAVGALRRMLQGELILPTDAAYDQARTIWNAMIDKRPALIARCASTADVAHAVDFARTHGLPLAVRGGGHNIAGNALCDGGLVIDLSGMKAVTVNTASRRVTVEGGALLSDLDAATQAHGLAVPAGINSTTGVAGLTLGGGIGWLSRKCGMTIDTLEAAEVVTANGEVVRATADENPDLFWALRGGGGNFGVVTRFEFRAHPVGPEVLSGLVVYPLAEAKAVLRRYRDFMEQAPNELTIWAVLRKAPPLPFLPESIHGKEVLVLALCYAGDPAQGEKLIAPVRTFGTPVGEHVGVQPFAAWQQAFDPLLGGGARNYWKSHTFRSLDDKLCDAVVDAAQNLPSPHCEIFIAALGGAASRPAPGATAYSQRDALYMMNLHGRWDTAAEDERGIRWARDVFNATAKYASGGVYVNFMTADESARVSNAYGLNYARLAAVKRRYDPGNLFRVNQNIKPA
jgi:FAD/FMN-containing dehydrogenase